LRGRLLLLAALALAGALLPAATSGQGPTSGQAPLPDASQVLLGHSAQGRAIRAVRVGDRGSARRALVVGVIHGSETAGLSVTRELRKRAGIAGVDLWIVDAVNPDGVARGARQNSRGVDLNRNFPWRWRTSSPGSGYYSGTRASSERETRVVMRWIERIRPAVTIWYHQPWGAVLRQCGGSAPVQARYAQLAGFPTSCRGASLPGTATSWENHTFPGTQAFVVELGGGALGAKAARRHARAAALVAEGR
jgi:protein MpaA